MNLPLALPKPGLDSILTHFRNELGPSESPVRAIRHEPATAGSYCDLPAALDPRLRAALERRGIARLYSHQAEAFDLVSAGANTVIVTPTASGKTLCYN